MLAGLGVGVLVSLAITVGGTAASGWLLRQIGADRITGAGTLTSILALLLAIAGSMLIFGWVMIRLPDARVSRRTAWRSTPAGRGRLRGAQDRRHLLHRAGDQVAGGRGDRAGAGRAGLDQPGVALPAVLRGLGGHRAGLGAAGLGRITGRPLSRLPGRRSDRSAGRPAAGAPMAIGRSAWLRPRRWPACSAQALRSALDRSPSCDHDAAEPETTGHRRADRGQHQPGRSS